MSRLVELERDGLAAAQGDALVHFDLYPHNILLAGERVLFVDWPHARPGSPVIDLVTLLSGAAADRLDPEPILRAHPALAAIPRGTIDSILVAHAGFLLNGGVSAAPPGLEAITAAKLHVGLGALWWLHRRLDERARRQAATRSRHGGEGPLC